jgi:hypothetical protein
MIVETRINNGKSLIFIHFKAITYKYNSISVENKDKL